MRDGETGDFIGYVESEELQFTVEVIDCAQEMTLGPDPRISSQSGTMTVRGNDAFTVAIDGSDAVMAL